MSKLLSTYRGTVYPWHCDHMNHMNVMYYVGKFDEATWNLMSHIGMSAAFLREHHRGMAAVDQRISYQRELHAGDTVAINSGIVSVRRQEDHLLPRDAQCRYGRGVRDHAADRGAPRHPDTQGLPAAGGIARAGAALVVSYVLPWS
jgi:acyl-CoA thioesterase FadM